MTTLSDTAPTLVFSRGSLTSSLSERFAHGTTLEVPAEVLQGSFPTALSIRHVQDRRAAERSRRSGPDGAQSPRADGQFRGDQRSAREAEIEALEERASQVLSAGHYGTARSLLLRALETRRALTGPFEASLLSTLLQLGVTASRANKLAEAKAWFTQARDLARMKCGSDSLELATALHNLGSIHRRRGEPKKARDCYERALKIKQARLGEAHPAVASTLAVLGTLARDLGDDDHALELYAYCREILDGCDGAGMEPSLAAALTGMATILLERDDAVAARYHLERALMIREQGAATAKQLARLNSLLADTMWRLGHAELASDYANVAYSGYRDSPQPAKDYLVALAEDAQTYKMAAAADARRSA